MNRYVKVLIMLAVFAAFGFLSRWDLIWQIALVIYVIAIFVMAWVAIRLIRKPDSANKFLDKYLMDELRMRQRKNM